MHTEHRQAVLELEAPDFDDPDAVGVVFVGVGLDAPMSGNRGRFCGLLLLWHALQEEFLAALTKVHEEQDHESAAPPALPAPHMRHK